jgi:hypothetical protein
VFDAATAWRERCQATTTSAWQRPQAADAFDVFDVFDVSACPSLATVAGPNPTRAAAISTRTALVARMAQPFSSAARLAWWAPAVRNDDVVEHHADGAGDTGRDTPSFGTAKADTMVKVGSRRARTPGSLRTSAALPSGCTWPRSAIDVSVWWRADRKNRAPFQGKACG